MKGLRQPPHARQNGCGPSMSRSGSSWKPTVDQWFGDFQSAYEHSMGRKGSPPEVTLYTGKYCVDICEYNRNEKKVFVIVQFGPEGSELRYEYEPLLALDAENGAVLMRFNWSVVQDNGDDTWADASSHRGPLGLFDDFETAYFYAQGLVREGRIATGPARPVHATGGHITRPPRTRSDHADRQAPGIQACRLPVLYDSAKTDHISQ